MANARTMRRATGRRSPAGPERRPAPSAAPDHGVIRLQAQAGNRAIATVLGVQRQRKTAGWTGADTSGPGWNVGAKDDVEGSGIRRIPVDDVPVGNQKDFADETYKDKKTGATISGRANEQAKTRESAAGRAIVLKPKLLNVDAPIDVLLHLHGYTSRAWDPYAGWRQSRKATSKGTDKDYRTVRDVDQDRIAQQIGAVNNPQILGILPQGVGHSQFNNLAPRTYVDAVLLRLEQISELAKPKSGTRQINLVLSAHSGGGHTIKAALNTELAAAAGKKTAGPVLAPTEVVLFEAINGAGELKAVTDWVDHHLGRTRDLLAAAKTATDRDAAVVGCPILRAYRSRDMYVGTYDKLTAHIKGWFDNPANTRVVGADAARLKDRFKVEVLTGITGGGGHERSIGGLGTAEQGPLADALAARRDPSASKLMRGGPAPAPAPTPGAPKAPRRSKRKAAAASTGASTTAAGITFGKRARADVVATSSLATLGAVLDAAGLTTATITSTARTPIDQARAMYQNLAGADTDDKVTRQYKLYGAGGDKVIDAFVELRDRGLGAAEIQAGMRDRIDEIGPRSVSKHLADPTKLNVLDVSPASLGGGDAVAKFEAAAQALVGSKIERLLTPGQGDPAEHIEMKPVGPTAGPPATADVPASTTPPATAKAEVVKAEAKQPVAPPVPAAPPVLAAPAAGAGAAPAPGFFADTARSTLELLPKDQRQRFAKIDWNDQDYPGAKHLIKDTSQANLDRWAAEPGFKVKKVAGKKGKPDRYFLIGIHQAEAQALLDALASVRPGGGERRANTGKHAILTKAQYKQDPDAFDEYIVEQLRDPDGVPKKGKRRMLNQHAATKFVEMRAAAKKDGVVLSIGNSFREREQAEASAAKKDNPKAVASYSAHSLGLAMDLNLSTKALGIEETTTRMPNTIAALSTPAYKWMFMRGAEFGFYQYRNEPWHWEYNPPGFADQFWADSPDLAPAAEEKPRKKGA